MEKNELLSDMLNEIEYSIMEAEEDFAIKKKRLRRYQDAVEESEQRLERFRILRLNLLYLMGE